jgi:hypothetical protein
MTRELDRAVEPWESVDEAVVGVLEDENREAPGLEPAGLAHGLEPEQRHPLDRERQPRGERRKPGAAREHQAAGTMDSAGGPDLDAVAVGAPRDDRLVHMQDRVVTAGRGEQGRDPGLGKERAGIRLPHPDHPRGRTHRRETT